MDYVKNPFVAIFPPFAIGIIFSILFPFNAFPVVVFLSVFLIILVIIDKKVFSDKPYLFGYVFFVFLFFLGVFVVNLKADEMPDLNSSEKIVYEGIIIQPPKEKPKTIQCVVQVEAFLDSTEWTNFSTKSVVYFQKDSVSESFKYGDRIVFQGYLNEITNAGNPAEFNYKSFLKNKGIFATSYSKNGKFIVLEHNLGNPLVRTAMKMRGKLLNIYKEFGFQGQEFAVLSALTLGYRDEVDSETRQMFANTGAMHILAVSGLHVGIIFMILNSLLKFMDKKRYLMYLKSLIVISSLWLFAAIAGLSPSVTRSALMFSMFVIGKMLMRTTSIYNIIFASAFILLLINPLDILSVGFQLSYAAVLSIVFLQPYIYKLFVFEKNIPDKTWALVSVSIAAQLGTMPIGLYYFHQFPNYFFLTNILVIPLASIILYLAVILFVVFSIPVLSGFVAFLLKLAMKVLIGGVSLIDSIPYSTTQNVSISTQQMFVLYAIILTFVLFWIYNRKNLLYAFLAFSSLFLVLNLFGNYHNKMTNEVVMYNSRNSFILNVLTGDENYVFADSNAINDKNGFNYSAKPYWLKKKVNEPIVYSINYVRDSCFHNNIVNFKNEFLTIGNTKFLFVNDDKMFNNQSPKKIKVDYVVLSNNVYLKIKDLLELVDFKQVVFDGTNKLWRIDGWVKECNTLEVPFFDMTHQGAFVVDFISSEVLKL